MRPEPPPWQGPCQGSGGSVHGEHQCVNRPGGHMGQPCPSPRPEQHPQHPQRRRPAAPRELHSATDPRDPEAPIPHTPSQSLCPAATASTALCPRTQGRESERGNRGSKENSGHPRTRAASPGEGRRQLRRERGGRATALSPSDLTLRVFPNFKRVASPSGRKSP